MTLRDTGWTRSPALAAGPLSPVRSASRAIPLLIALVTCAVFTPSLWNGFVDYDDNRNFVDNPHYRGLGWAQLRWMFTTAKFGHWIPLTWMTLGLDYLLWGMNPLGYHLSSLLLPAANSAAFYLVILRLLRVGAPELSDGTYRLAAATGALVFAVHPLRVESVAWVTERRDVLSGLFYLLTILCYLQMSEAEGAPRRRWLMASVGCYVLALLSKSIVMTLPFVLILLDVYPLRRLGPSWRAWTSREARGIWAEKLPYLVLAIASASVTVGTLRAHALLTPVDAFPPSARIAAACYSLTFYLWKSICPVGLIAVYELPAEVDVWRPPFLFSALAVVALAVGCWALRRRWPWGLAAAGAYLVTLAPVSGLATWSEAARQVVADRYSYLSCLPWAVLVGGAICAIMRAASTRTLPSGYVRLTVGAAAVWIAALAMLSSSQVRIWRDTETLWRHALDIDPSCALCHSQLGAALGNRDLMAAALGHFERAVALRPGEPIFQGNLGLALLRSSRPTDAMTRFELVLARRPEDVDARNRLGVALIRQGKLLEATVELERVIQLNPDHTDALTNLGIALTALGRAGESVPVLERAVRLRPDAPLPRWWLGRAYLALGRPAAAAEEIEILRRLDPVAADQLLTITSATTD
jgi:protein O-mannosyl-transferase